MPPQKFFKNLHIVQQLGLAGFSFLAEHYHGMIRIWDTGTLPCTQEQIGPSVHGFGSSLGEHV
jgi:hypothetical protein